MAEEVASNSDARTVNNAVRHTYRVLSDAEKLRMQEIKDMGAAFIAKLHEIGGTDPAATALLRAICPSRTLMRKTP